MCKNKKTYVLEYILINKKKKESQSDSSILVLLDHRLLKNEYALSFDKMNLQESNSIIISSKVNISHLF